MIVIKRFFNLIIWKFIHNSLEYRLNKLYEFDKTKKYPEVKSINETIDKLLNSNCSIVRFGDGEFNLSLGRSISFQTKNRELSRELQKILKSKNQSEILVAISPFTPKIFGLRIYSILQVCWTFLKLTIPRVLPDGQV